MKKLRVFFIMTDTGFLLYWLITLLHLIPKSLLFNDYRNSILISWNWSFLPLDMFISFTGFFSLYLYSKGNEKWRKLSLISLVLTFCSGLQAISFWTIRKDFEVMWWIFNGYLMIYPLFFIKSLINDSIK